MSKEIDHVAASALAHHYRTDIEGLRAIAVLGVVLFHLDSHWLPGGFVGVDIFFVISGFLITGNILRESSAGVFNFGEFYRRRILRILPALTLVVGVTLVIGQLAMLPAHFTNLAISAAAAQASVANIYFTYFLDTGYFAEGAVLQPLLHLWSLGVEEQFYLFWPILLVLGLNRIPKWVLWTSVAAVTATSFAVAQWMLADDPSFAYYMLPSRAGQFLAGGLLAAALSSGWAIGPVLANATGLIGGALLIISFVQINDSMGYPGLNALPPTAATVLLLLSGSTSNWVSATLSMAPLRFVGRISYSLYLWHWPVLSFWWYAFGPPDLSVKGLLLVVMFALSALSYSAVERPFRRLPHGVWKSAFLYFGMPLNGATLAALLAVGTAGYGIFALSPSYGSQLKVVFDGAGPAYRASYVCQETLVSDALTRKPDCVINGGRATAAILWGDSNAAHYVGALGQAAEEFGFSFRNIAHASCPPIIDRPERFTRADRGADCVESVAAVTRSLQGYPSVILSAAWHTYLRQPDFDTALGETITTLRSMGHEVFVIGRIPRMPKFDRYCEAKRIKLPFIDCAPRSMVSATEAEGTNATIRNIAEAAGGTYFDFNDAVCSGGVCWGTIAGRGLYYDEGHWSIDGSISVGKFARDHAMLPPALLRLANGQKASSGEAGSVRPEGL
jgi:peptidoglycan/LPS O-acetylase OafA/YrhL